MKRKQKMWMLFAVMGFLGLMIPESQAYRTSDFSRQGQGGPRRAVLRDGGGTLPLALPASDHRCGQGGFLPGVPPHALSQQLPQKPAKVWRTAPVVHSNHSPRWMATS